MRFAYIDSNGNEVPIPSVDALALRIELGAINENTQLYDAQADQWGPAHSHEIFHTLSRVADEGDGGFVAPLPPLPPPPPPPEPAEEGVTAAVEEETEEVAEPEPQAEPEPEPAAKGGLEDLGLSLAAEPAPDNEPVEQPAAAFDFGDLGGPLEMETGFSEPERGEDSGAAMDFGSPLEQEMQFGGPDDAMDLSGGGLDLERPMSEFTPEAPPAWMEPADVAPAEDVMDFSSIPSESAATTAAPTAGDVGARRAPRDRPSRPRFRRQRNLVAPIVGVVTLSAIGVGGYVAWPVVNARLESRRLPANPEIVLPPVPEELLPQMREIADAALASTFAAARAAAGPGVPSPGRSWLAGVYFANASQYDDVVTFWNAIQDEVDAVRAIDLPTFHAAYASGMAAAGVAEENRAILMERADSGFVAAARARSQTLALVDELVSAALGLHDFLIANEANIEYTPAARGTSDPVLEARPATPAIADAMEVRIDRVTEALDGLDYLDLVTADGLWRAVLRRIQETGFR